MSTEKIGEFAIKYQDCVSKVKSNKEKNDALRQMDQKIVSGIVALNGTIVDMVMDTSTDITQEIVKGLYNRIQILTCMSEANGTLLRNELSSLRDSFKQISLTDDNTTQKMISSNEPIN